MTSMSEGNVNLAELPNNAIAETTEMHKSGWNLARPVAWLNNS